MAGSLNKVQLIGNLGSDPESRTVDGVGEVVNLSIATTESWRDKSTGEKKEKTEWHRVVCYSDGLIKVCKSYLSKGSKVYVEGALKTRKYDKDGVTHYATEIVLQGFGGTLTMLDGKSDAAPKQDGSFTGQTDNDIDDKIPF